MLRHRLGFVLRLHDSREDDALGYVRAYNERDLRAKHDKNVASDYTPPNAQYKCRDPIETCPGCDRYYADLDH